MSRPEDDLLPGDEDAILGDLARHERSAAKTQMMADTIRDIIRFSPEYLRHFPDTNNRDDFMPMVDRADHKERKFRWYSDYGLQIHRPSTNLKITSV